MKDNFWPSKSRRFTIDDNLTKVWLRKTWGEQT